VNSKVPFLVFILFVLSSCASLQVYEPSSESAFTDETNFAGYNSTAQVAWITTVDDSNLIIRIETESQLSKIKILQQGMYIYFSTTGKKSRDNYIHFPLGVEKKNKNKNKTDDPSKSRRGQRITTQDLITRINPIAEYVYADKKEEFHYKLNSENFKINISEDSNTLLRYTLSIPFNKVVDSPEQLNGLVIGLVSGAFDAPVRTRPMQTNRPRNMRNGGGRMPTNAGAPNWQTQSYSAMAEPIKIWFKLENVK
jgi:hypothetical protein